MNLKQIIRRVLKEELYSPAGKEIIPNKIVVHKSNPMFRDKILQDGLKVRTGECYKIYVGYGIKCRPAIFATNSTNKRAWFDSTYDDDIWEINTEMIPDVKWFKDRHYESRSKHIVTFQDIPKEAITLKYEGTGSGDYKLWSKDSPNRIQESHKEKGNEKVNLVKKMIHKLYNNVSFIKQSTLNDKPHLMIYFDSDDTAANIESWFDEKIYRDIIELTSGNIVACPDWVANWDSRKKEADVYINTELLRYDNLGNVINESSKSIRRILREETQNSTNIKETLLEKFFNKKFNDVIFEEEPELNSRWLDKDDTQLFIRNWYGVLWVTDCPFYNDLWVKAHMLDFSLDEFHVLLSKFVNKNYEHKNRPIRRVFDSYNCSDLV